MYSFKKFISLKEWADFGFGEKLKKSAGGTKSVEGNMPIDIIHSSKIISELLSTPEIGNYIANPKFQNLIEWGDEAGALQLQLTPLGSYKIVARRKVIDAVGESTWICKKVFPLDEGYHNTREEIYASEIHTYLVNLNEQLIDSPNVQFKGFDKLSLKMFNNVRKVFPSYCMFPIGMYKKSENYHKYVFEFRGGGVEAPTAGRAEQFNIDLLWEPKRGLIRCWGYDIDSTTRQHSWKVQPSEWDEYFAPTQDTKEIVESISRIFMTY